MLAVMLHGNPVCSVPVLNLYRFNEVGTVRGHDEVCGRGVQGVW